MKLSPRISGFLYYLWLLLMLAALGASGFFTYSVVSYYKAKSNTSIDEGKRVAIVVETGDVIIRKIEEEAKPEEPKTEEPKPEEKTAAPPVEYGPPVAPNAPKTETAPTPVGDGSNKFAVIIVNMGVNKAITDSAKNLPAGVTFSFSPYAPNLGNQMEEARKDGHETLLDLPMQTENYPYEDPGPNAILADAGKAKNMFRLKSTLALAEGYPGVMSSVGEQITHSLVNILPVIDELKKHQLFFVYNEKPSNQSLLQEAKAVGLKVVNSYSVIDDVLTDEAIDGKIAEAVKTFNEGKNTVIVSRPYPITIKRLENWVKNMRESGKTVTISPVSHLQQ